MKKKRGSKAIVNILSVLFILFVLLELQIMFNYPDQFVWFVGIGALILIDVYFLVSVAVNQKNAAQADKEEQFENITKSEKASYLLLKKCFQDLDDRMSRLEDQLEPLESAIAENEIRVQRGLSQSITDNKKMAKILLGKNKEQTEALINANDQMQRILKGFEQKLSDMESRISQYNSSGEGGMTAEQYQEIMLSIQNLEMSFQKQVDQVIESPTPVSELEFVEDMDMMEAMEPEPAPQRQETSRWSREPEIIPEPAPMSALQSLWKMQQEEKRMMEAASKPEPEPEVEEIAEPEPEIPEMTAEPEPESDIVGVNVESEPDIAGVNVESEPEPDIAGVNVEPEPEIPEMNAEPEIPEMNTEPESEPEPEIPEMNAEPELEPELPLMEEEPEEVLESELEEIFETGLELEPEEAIEPELPLMEEDEEEDDDMPDLGDPNKVMSPEEIAALIANM